MSAGSPIPPTAGRCRWCSPTRASMRCARSGPSTGAASSATSRPRWVAPRRGCGRCSSGSRSRHVADRHIAVVDLGSNSFRMVVFTAGNGWWKRTDEIHEAVRIGEGADHTGELGEEPMARALTTIELFAHFCRATGLDEIHPVATSAIRTASNRPLFLRRARKHLDVRVLSEEEEARYGYRAAVNSTSLGDGAVLDLGGGSLQLVRVEGRRE